MTTRVKGSDHEEAIRAANVERFAARAAARLNLFARGRRSGANEEAHAHCYCMGCGYSIPTITMRTARAFGWRTVMFDATDVLGVECPRCARLWDERHGPESTRTAPARRTCP